MRRHGSEDPHQRERKFTNTGQKYSAGKKTSLSSKHRVLVWIEYQENAWQEKH